MRSGNFVWQNVKLPWCERTAMGAEGFSWKRALILAGACISLVIGSGFATGQELVQYFTAYGLGGLAVVAIFAIVFIYYNLNFARVGAQEKYDVGNKVFQHFCGKKLGTFFDYYSTAFCYMSFFVMIGGASSTLQQGFGLPSWVGGALVCAIVVAIVCLGLSKLVDIIGVIGPIKIAFFLGVGLVVLCMDWQQVPAGLSAVETGNLVGATATDGMVKAGDNWLISGLSYAGFVLLWFASFMTLLGAKNDPRSLSAGIVIATAVICLAIAVIFFAQLANINTGENGVFVWNAPIPNLILAQKVWAPLSIIYSVVVFIGICATAVPLLYNPTARFAKEGTPRFRLLAVGLGVAGLVIGLFVPYRTLVNVVYVINGYIGAVLLVFMVARNLRDFVAKRRAAKRVTEQRGIGGRPAHGDFEDPAIQG